MFFFSRKRQEKRLRKQVRQPLMLEALEDRQLLSSTPTTVLDLNGLSVDANKYSSSDILVRFQETPGKAGGPAIVAGTTLGSELPLTNGYYKVDLGKGLTVSKALSDYKAEKGVLSAEPDYELSVSSVPNDPLLSQQWALSNKGQNGGKPGADIHAEQAWSVTNSSPNIIVAVLDTGVDYDQPDLYDNIWINQADIPNYWYTKSSPTSGYNKIVYKWQLKTATPGIITFRDLNNPANRGLVWDNNGDGRIDAGDLLRSIKQGGWEQPGKANDLFGWNYVSNNNNPMDDNGHGTNVAGILGAIGNNGTGVTGVDWNVQIMPVKFIGADGYGSISDFIESLNYAVQHGAKITNNSWEGAPYSQALYDAFLNAQQHGVICVAAAGNEGSNDDFNPDYPASLSTKLNNIVTVAATDNTDRLASFSNYGVNSIDLAAPGVNILSTLPNGRYGAMSGTSMATPEVAGALALVWGQHPSWNYTQVIDQVLNTTDKLPSLEGKVKTGGRLDLAAAVGWNLSTQTTPTITRVDGQGPTSNSMNSIVLTFNEAIDVSSFSSAGVTLTNPNGAKIPVSVQVVSNSGDREMKLTFADQTMLGSYHLFIGSNVRDLMGVRMEPFSTILTLQAPKTYTHSTASAIKPHSLTMSSLWLPNGTIGDVTVNVNINYPYDRDLYVYLVSPTGKTIALDYNRGGWSGNLTNTTFSEQARTPIADGRAPFDGTYRPDASLGQLTGTNSSGTWRLGIYNSGIESGTLRNWSLTITPAVSVSDTKTSSAEATPTGTTAPKTYTNSISEYIKPKSLTMSTVSVPTGASSGNSEVRVNLTYPYTNELYVYLIAPNGKTITLEHTREGWVANFSNKVYAEKPGVWRLAIRNSGTQWGSLHDWSLTVQST